MTAWIPDVVTDQVIASSWGNTIRDRTLTPFANPADRDTAIPTPKAGMVVWMLDSKCALVYTGTKWTTFGRQNIGWKVINGNFGFGNSMYDISGGGVSVIIPANCLVAVTFGVYGYKVLATASCAIRCVSTFGNLTMGPATYSNRLTTDLTEMGGVFTLAAAATQVSTVIRCDGSNNTSGDISCAGNYTVDILPT